MRHKSALARAALLHCRGLPVLLRLAVRDKKYPAVGKPLTLERVPQPEDATHGPLAQSSHVQQLDKFPHLEHESLVVLAAAAVQLLRNGARQGLGAKRLRQRLPRFVARDAFRAHGTRKK